jgi:hypothetical protein
MAVVPLDLDTCPRASVFAALVKILRDDATLKRVFGKKGSFRAWTGLVDDNKPFSVENAPAIRLTPVPTGADRWYSPDSTEADLGVQVELVIRGSNAADLMNVWWAVQRAVYPKDQAARQANASALQAAGSFTGMVDFLDPAYDPDAAAAGYFYALGRLKVDVLQELNP